MQSFHEPAIDKNIKNRSYNNLLHHTINIEEQQNIKKKQEMMIDSMIHDKTHNSLSNIDHP